MPPESKPPAATSSAGSCSLRLPLPPANPAGRAFAAPALGIQSSSTDDPVMPLSRGALRLICVAVAIAAVLLTRVATGHASDGATRQPSVIGDDTRQRVTDTTA